MKQKKFYDVISQIERILNKAKGNRKEQNEN